MNRGPSGDTRCRGRRTLASSAGWSRSPFALMSGIERYDTTLFSIHMVQHLLLMLVAAPLIALAAPITLLLRVARPTSGGGASCRSSTRGAIRGLCLPGRRLAAVRGGDVGHPLLAAVRRGAREPVAPRPRAPPVPVDGAAVLVAGRRPRPEPVADAPPGPGMYVFLQMPQNTFLAVVDPVSPARRSIRHYATLDRPWGPSPLDDQQLAGGDHVARRRRPVHRRDRRDRRRLDALRGARTRPGADRRADAERAAIRAREVALAERLADQQEQRQRS